MQQNDVLKASESDIFGIDDHVSDLNNRIIELNGDH